MTTFLNYIFRDVIDHKGNQNQMDQNTWQMSAGDSQHPSFLPFFHKALNGCGDGNGKFQVGRPKEIHFYHKGFAEFEIALDGKELFKSIHKQN